jgi:hypothetical protein
VEEGGAIRGVFAGENGDAGWDVYFGVIDAADVLDREVSGVSQLFGSCH